jgi:carbonic anhydrase/acetyltransferase-like protein (isoleucine patch superfamily)
VTQALAPYAEGMTFETNHSRITVPGHGTPVVDDSAYVADGARLAGNVTLEANVGIWFNAVLRADYEAIRIGVGSNIQDNVTCHVDTGYPLNVGKNVSVGHNAVLHGCTIEDDCLVGMSATVMNGAVIGAGSLVAAGALVLEGTIVPPGSLVAGVPAKVRRELTDEERQSVVNNAINYQQRILTYRS